MTNEHQQQTAFLRHCLLYDDTEERHKLEERITQVQRDEICVRRAVWRMALFAALALAGLGYAAVFLADYPLNASQFATRLAIKVLGVLGVGSLICLLAFVGLGGRLSEGTGPAAGGMSPAGHETLGVSPGQANHHALARQANPFR